MPISGAAIAAHLLISGGRQLVRKYWKRAAVAGAGYLGYSNMPRYPRRPFKAGMRGYTAAMQVEQARPDRPRVRMSGGHYAGKLRAPRKLKSPSKYEKHGYTKEIERFGQQSLSDVCYIGGGSICHKDVGPVVGVALIRKLMKRHYMYDYTSVDQAVVPSGTSAVLPQINVGSVGPQRLEFWYEEITGADAQPTYGIGYTLVLYDLATLTALSLAQCGELIHTNVFMAIDFGNAQGSAQYPIRRIHGYRFVELDYTVQSQFEANLQPVTRMTTLFSLKNQYLTVYSAVKLAIQNVTPGDLFGIDELSATRIDANPIKGKLLKFKDPLPLLQQRMGAFGNLPNDNSYKLQIDPNGDGIILPQVDLIGDWRQVPTARMFQNCVGERYVNFNPGDIKDYSLFFRFNGTLEKFMRGFNANTAAGSNVVAPLAKGLFGQSFLFCLDKRMPTGDSDVTVNFNYTSNVGCVFGKRLGMLMQRTGVPGVNITPE